MAFDSSVFERPVIIPPQDPALWPAFREALTEWRQRMRQRLNYNDALYHREDFDWITSSFACCFVMLNDEAFYDAASGQYTVDEFLDAGRRDFGGYDSIVLWHAYPRIGVDARNQFDFYRDAPGGLAGLRHASQTCHRRGIRVYIDYNPWDTGTRREKRTDLDMLAEMVSAIEADGIFLDTMKHGAAELRAKLDAARPGVVLEGECVAPLEHVHDHHMSWAQQLCEGLVPGILRNKWFERRHMQHQISRWSHDHTAELHDAWMNGSGMMIWENVFGVWGGWNARDRSILREMLPIQRRYAHLFAGDEWTPLVSTEQPSVVFAHLWESRGVRLWTLVNRGHTPAEGALLTVPAVPGQRCFDLTRGCELNCGKGGTVELRGCLPARGIGAFVCGDEQGLGPDIQQFVQQQAELHQRFDADTTFPARRSVHTPAGVTQRRPASSIPENMVALPAPPAQQHREVRIRECGFYESQTDVPQDLAWLRLRTIERCETVMGPFAIDLTPVTNAQYAEFIRATGYRPAHAENFLRHWCDGRPAVGAEDHPVVYVDLDDARAYARWQGKRLPTEAEWQFAAAGAGNRRYPWGDQMESNKCNDSNSGTTPVDTYPNGRSPCGCYDMCGNTWEWTESEYTDGRNRFCMIRGGSHYKAEGSIWYVDGGPQPNQVATKMLLTWPGLDRCATIGFRCTIDLTE